MQALIITGTTGESEITAKIITGIHGYDAEAEILEVQTLQKVDEDLHPGVVIINGIGLEDSIVSVVQAVRDHWGERGHFPFIVVVGRPSSNEVVVAAFEAGAEEVLRESYNPMELSAQIMSFFRRERWKLQGSNS